GRGDGEGQLDRELVTVRALTFYGRAEPPSNLRTAGIGEQVQQVARVVVPCPGDQAVPLQAGQRRVHLPDVERPGAPGALLEPRLELVAVRGALVEEREQALSDRHTGYVYPVWRRRQAA